MVTIPSCWQMTVTGRRWHHKSDILESCWWHHHPPWWDCVTCPSLAKLSSPSDYITSFTSSLIPLLFFVQNQHILHLEPVVRKIWGGCKWLNHWPPMLMLWHHQPVIDICQQQLNNHLAWWSCHHRQWCLPRGRSTYILFGGGVPRVRGYSDLIWTGVCRPSLKTLTLF